MYGKLVHKVRCWGLFFQPVGHNQRILGHTSRIFPWSKFRNHGRSHICFDVGSREVCNEAPLIRHCTDSAAKELKGLVKLTFPSMYIEHWGQSSSFIGLPLPNFVFYAPLLRSEYPSIAYPCWDHSARTVVRNLMNSNITIVCGELKDIWFAHLEESPSCFNREAFQYHSIDQTKLWCYQSNPNSGNNSRITYTCTRVKGNTVVSQGICLDARWNWPSAKVISLISTSSCKRVLNEEYRKSWSWGHTWYFPWRFF